MVLPSDFRKALAPVWSRRLCSVSLDAGKPLQEEARKTRCEHHCRTTMPCHFESQKAACKRFLHGMAQALRASLSRKLRCLHLFVAPARSGALVTRFCFFTRIAPASESQLACREISSCLGMLAVCMHRACCLPCRLEPSRTGRISHVYRGAPQQLQLKSLQQDLCAASCGTRLPPSSPR